MEGYRRLQLLGKGAQGEVYLYQKTGVRQSQLSLTRMEKSMRYDYFAVKVIKKGQHIERDILILLSKLFAHKGIIHKNIMEVVDFKEDSEFFYIISEYISNVTTLTEYLKEERSFLDLFNIMHQITDGLHYIHKLGICHRDIKLNNILIKGTTPIIIDFGLACICDKDKVKKLINEEHDELQCRGRVGTPNYIDPNILTSFLLDKKTYVSADIYSLGSVFYYIMNGIFPYNLNINDFKDIKKRKDANPSESGFVEIDHMINHILSKTRERPSLKEIMNIISRNIKRFDIEIFTKEAENIKIVKQVPSFGPEIGKYKKVVLKKEEAEKQIVKKGKIVGKIPKKVSSTETSSAGTSSTEEQIRKIPPKIIKKMPPKIIKKVTPPITKKVTPPITKKVTPPITKKIIKKASPVKIFPGKAVPYKIYRSSSLSDTSEE